MHLVYHTIPEKIKVLSYDYTTTCVHVSLNNGRSTSDFGMAFKIYSLEVQKASDKIIK